MKRIIYILIVIILLLTSGCSDTCGQCCENCHKVGQEYLKYKDLIFYNACYCTDGENVTKIY